jgi:hypothetical protein
LIRRAPKRSSAFPVMSTLRGLHMSRGETRRT